MAHPPTLGIASWLDPGTLRPGRETAFVDAALPRAILAAGGVPVVLPRADPGALLDRVEALVVPGGDDFPPTRPYPADVPFALSPPEQIAFDRALLDAARARGLPILGICYGMQLLALACGGALHHQLPLDLPDALPHGGGGAARRHAVRIVPDSRLAGALGPLQTMVESRHHQAVADPGSLRVVAHADDGVIEAIEDDASPFCVGVQWHPESREDVASRALFEALVAACQPSGAGRT